MNRPLIALLILFCLGGAGLWGWWEISAVPDDPAKDVKAKSAAREAADRVMGRHPLSPEESLALYRKVEKRLAQGETAQAHLDDLRKAIAGLGLAEVREIARERLAEFEANHVYDETLYLLLDRWASDEPQVAWAALEETRERVFVAEKVGDGPFNALTKYTNTVLLSWARGDAAGALAVINERSEGLIMSEVVETWRLPHTILAELSERDPAAARTAVLSLRGMVRLRAMSGYFEGLPTGTDWAALAEGIDGLLPSTLEAALDPSLVAAERLRVADNEPLLLFPEMVERATRYAQDALTKRWLREEITPALEWYARRTRESVIGEVDEAEHRAQRVGRFLGRHLGESPDEIIRWVRDQPWEWERTDELPLSMLEFSGSQAQLNELLRAVRSEENRFSYLRDFAENTGLWTGDPESESSQPSLGARQVFEAWLEVADLTPAHEATLRELHTKVEIAPRPATGGSPERSSQLRP